jgi:hypothetical protein
MHLNFYRVKTEGKKMLLLHFLLSVPEFRGQRAMIRKHLGNDPDCLNSRMKTGVISQHIS